MTVIKKIKIKAKKDACQEVGMESTMESSTEVPQKLDIKLACNPCIPLLGI
jgi:hypothetical protein